MWEMSQKISSVTLNLKIRGNDMRVMCCKTIGDYPPLVLPENPKVCLNNQNVAVSREWYTIDERTSGYSITLDHLYEVLGIISYGNSVRFLIFDDKGIPGFFPAPLFRVEKPEVFFDWELCKYELEDALLLFVGCPAFAHNYLKLIELINGNNNAIEELLDYKEYVHRYL